MELLLRNVRPLGAAALDVLVRGGRIAALGPKLDAVPGVAEEEGSGALLLPGLVEAHAHLDKTNWGLPWYVNEVGARLEDRIANERRWRAQGGHDAGPQSLRLAHACRYRHGCRAAAPARRACHPRGIARRDGDPGGRLSAIGIARAGRDGGTAG